MAQVLLDWLNELMAQPTITHDDIRSILDEIDEEAEAFWLATKVLWVEPRYAE